MKQSLNEIKEGIEIFCESHLPSGEEIPIKNGKIIHDTTWKTNFFEPYEIAIVNTPLFQRLRYINQMGFVNYVYPSAKHSRFEHSLGVTILAGKMIDSLHRDQYSKNFITDKDKTSIRLSALLHDVGHCLFSHTSELVYSSFLAECKAEELKGKDVDPAPHEFLSYLIVNSKCFGKYFKKLQSSYSELHDIDIQEIANRIIGYVKNESNRYKTSFINGPIDADKLDYFHRDSQFSGIPIQLDIERLFYEITISKISDMDKEVEEEVYDLTVGISGIGCIEQIIFNKMLLYSAIYHHHKVQAMDCMFKGIFEYIIDNNIQININGKKKEIDSPVDFLFLVDRDLFAIVKDTTDDKLKRLINNIQERNLLKRALVINQGSIKKKTEKSPVIQEDIAKLETLLINKSDEKFNENLEVLIHVIGEKFLQSNKGAMKGLMKILQSNKNAYQRELAKEILEDAKVDCLLSEIWIDIPKIPSFTETSTLNIRTNKDKTNTNYMHIDDFYPYNPYKDLYITNKMNCHVFAPEYCLKEIANSAKKIFKEKLDIEFNDRADIYINK